LIIGKLMQGPSYLRPAIVGQCYLGWAGAWIRYPREMVGHFIVI
jgi:hypothetical protein